MKRLFSLFLLLTVSVSVAFSQKQKVSFYFSAHPDDWQLFMGVNAFKDIADASASNNRVVFLYTTAGEANCRYQGVNMNYVNVRQTGANRSVQFCADIYSPHTSWETTHVAIQGMTPHNILQLKYKNIVSYCLRLPDGCFEQILQTMTKLAQGQIDSLTAVDNSTTYYGYKDLLETVKNIVAYESNVLPQPEVWLNASDWDPSINPGDHPDHQENGRMVTDIASRIGYANVQLFEGYNTCNKASNMTPEEVAMEAGLHSQVCYALTHEGWPTEWDPDNFCGHVEWTNKNYYRVYSRATDVKPAPAQLTMNPNPANSKTINLTYEVVESGPVTIELFDMLGNVKRNIVNDNEGIGVHSISYDIASLANGNYIIYAKTQGYVHTLRFTKL